MHESSSALLLTDASLVARIRTGDRTAPTEVVRRHADAMYGVALAKMGNSADAEDVVQQAFMGALRTIDRFENRASLKTWLLGIVIRQASNALRSRRIRRSQDLGAEGSDAEHGAVRRPTGEALSAVTVETIDRQLDVMTMLATLSPDHREVLVLYELQGLTYSEIAQVLSIPPGTVESRLCRARQALARRFGEKQKS